jgi:hypothetical protein
MSCVVRLITRTAHYHHQLSPAPILVQIPYWNYTSFDYFIGSVSFFAGFYTYILQSSDPNATGFLKSEHHVRTMNAV